MPFFSTSIDSVNRICANSFASSLCLSHAEAMSVKGLGPFCSTDCKIYDISSIVIGFTRNMPPAAFIISQTSCEYVSR